MLCAFEVLLGESNGCMRDVLGNEIDLVRAMRSGAHTGGVLASAEPSLNYMLKHVAPAFEANRLFAPVPPAASHPDIDPNIDPSMDPNPDPDH